MLEIATKQLVFHQLDSNFIVKFSQSAKSSETIHSQTAQDHIRNPYQLSFNAAIYMSFHAINPINKEF